MKNKGRLIRLLIALLLPLISTVFIISYSYNRDIYRDAYVQKYYQKTKDAEGIANRYVRFESDYMANEDFYNYTYKDEEGNAIFKFAIKQFLRIPDSNSDVESDFLVNYRLFAYDVDYEKLIHLVDDFVKEDTPRIVDIKVAFINDEKVEFDEDDDEEVQLPKRLQTVLLSNLGSLVDQNALPKKDHNGEEATYMIKSRWLQELADMPENLRVVVYTGSLFHDKNYDEVRPKPGEEYVEYFEFNLDNIIFEANESDIDLNNFTKGFKTDVIKAGYTAYIIKNKIWWQAILTLLIVGFFSFSFLFVWEYEKKITEKHN